MDDASFGLLDRFPLNQVKKNTLSIFRLLAKENREYFNPWWKEREMLGSLLGLKGFESK